VAIRRFPVKSLAGESLPTVEVDTRGLAGDRLWAVVDADGKLGSGKNTRRFRRMDGLLRLQATYDADGVPVVTLPDGSPRRADDPELDGLLGAVVGREVRLAREQAVSHFDDGPVSLVTTAALRALADVLGDEVDPRRFRANLVVDHPGPGWAEDDWVGRTVRVGGRVRLRVDAALARCVMVDMAQEDLPDDGRLLKTLADHHDLCFGVRAHVEETGAVSLGDAVTLD
jgi:uncharacterized protein YcbX